MRVFKKISSFALLIFILNSFFVQLAVGDEAVQRRKLFPPSSALPIPPPEMEQASSEVSSQPSWIQRAQDWFRANVQGQILQPLPQTPATGNRLLQLGVEETPRTDHKK